MMTTEVSCDTCDPSSGDPNAGTTTYDDYGDSITDNGDGTYDFSGDYTGADYFDLSNIYDDFGTDEVNVNEDGYTVAATSGTVNPMTDACKAALKDLNVAFLNFVGSALGMIAAIAAGGLVGVGGKERVSGNPDDFTILKSFGDPAVAVGSYVDLNNKQNVVDSACAGQGAGRNPYG